MIVKIPTGEVGIIVKPIAKPLMGREALIATLLEKNGERTLYTLCGTVGYVQSIEREDGSGYCFNVRMLTLDGKYVKQFVRFHKATPIKK